jgi:hypothetical protein
MAEPIRYSSTICPRRPTEQTRGMSSQVVGLRARVRVLDTGSAPGSATVASTIVCIFPAGPVPRSLGLDFTTMCVAWPARSASPSRVPDRRRRRAGHTVQPDPARTPADGQVLVWDPGIALYLVDPVTGKATRMGTAWTNALGIFW